MKTFLSLINNQIREGTSVAILGGTIIGLIIGIFIVTLENANLMFPNILTRVYLVVFLTTLAALASILVFLLLEFAMAFGSKISSKLSEINLKRFYINSFLIGVLFFAGFLWIGFNVAKDITSVKGLALSSTLFLSTFALFLILTKFCFGKKSIREKGPRSFVILILILVYSTAFVIAYKNLSSRIIIDKNSETHGGLSSPSFDKQSHFDGDRLNVILISIDTLRPDHLSIYDYPRQTSPNMDILAKEGIVFHNARSQAPWTLPSHATMFTSLYPSSHGARFYNNARFLNPRRLSDKLAEWHLTITEILKANDYETAAFTSGSWLNSIFGFDQGFDVLENNMSTHNASTIVDKAIDWIATEDKQKPFFLFLHFIDVHNYTSPAEYDELYQDKNYDGKLKGEENLKKKIMGNLYDNLKSSDLNYLIAKYDGAIKYVDHELSRLFSFLNEIDQYNNTIIIITSDHGEEFLEHGGTGHGFTLYEEQLRVPLIIKTPLEESRRVENEVYANVGIIDITPTILDYLNLPSISTFEGRSLRPLIDAEIKTSTTYIAEAAIFHNMYATIQDGHKYIGNRFIPAKLLSPSLWFVTIRSFFKFKKDELYSIGNDPYEKNNLFEQEKELASVMRNDLLEHIKKSKPGQQIEINRETIEQLRSLGYIH